MLARLRRSRGVLAEIASNHFEHGCLAAGSAGQYGEFGLYRQRYVGS